VLPAGFVTVTVSHFPVETVSGTVATSLIATVPPPSVTCAADANQMSPSRSVTERGAHTELT